MYTDNGYRVYQAPSAVAHKLHEVYAAEPKGENAEDVMLLAAAAMGYYPRDQYGTYSKTEIGTYLHSVCLERDITPGFSLSRLWVHCNHPRPAEAIHRGEWYMYSL